MCTQTDKWEYSCNAVSCSIFYHLQLKMINLHHRHVLCYVSTAVYVVMLDAPLVEMVVFEYCHKNNLIHFFMPTSMKSTHAKCLKMAGVCYLLSVYCIQEIWHVYDVVSAEFTVRYSFLA